MPSWVAFCRGELPTTLCSRYASTTASRCVQQFHWKNILHVQRSNGQEVLATESDFYNYTAKRWLVNESFELSQRRVNFSIPDLFDAAVQAVGRGATRCLKAVKYREGQYNKTFRLDLDNRIQVVVKLPNPNAGPSHFTTASEVATMDYIRNELKIPVPKILGWNSNTTNPVGSEYIIMEPARGQLLSERWYQLEKKAKYDIITQVVNIQATLAARLFPGMGSLYYKDNPILNVTSQSLTSEEIPDRFVLGPMVSPEPRESTTSGAPIYKGPWRDLTGYALDLGHREIAWLQDNAEPRMNHFRQEQEQPAEARELVEKYLKIVPFITRESRDTSPITSMYSLSHPDLHLSNIFIDPQTNIISDIIDWQTTCVMPLLLQAKLPRMVRHVEPLELGLFMPQQPEHTDDTNQEARNAADKLHQSALCQKYYETRLANTVPNLYSALVHNITYRLPFLEPLGVVSGAWRNHTIFKLRASLINIVDHWQNLFPDQTSCPITFDEQTIIKHDEELENLDYIESMMEAFEREGILPADGIVDPRDYDALQKVNADQKQRYLTLAQNEEERDVMEKTWPWQDWPERSTGTG